MRFRFLYIIGFLLTINTLIAGTVYTIISGLSGTVIKDESTGLIWTQCSLISQTSVDNNAQCLGDREKFEWNAAIEACENLDYAGKTDWRLPNIKELQSIGTYYYRRVPAINTDYFLNTYREGSYRSHYWSSTTCKSDAQLAWFVDFYLGNVYYDKKSPPSEEKYVRCVRGPEP